MSHIDYYKQTIFDELGKSIDHLLLRYLVPCAKKEPSDIRDYCLPDIDIKEEENFYVVTADIPGVEEKDIKIDIDKNNNLVIEVREGTKITHEGPVYAYFERNKRFLRKIALPSMIDPQNIKAKYQNGVLEISIPKSKKYLIKKIGVAESITEDTNKTDK